jgi:hypothetical protein
LASTQQILAELSAKIDAVSAIEQEVTALRDAVALLAPLASLPAEVSALAARVALLEAQPEPTPEPEPEPTPEPTPIPTPEPVPGGGNAGPYFVHDIVQLGETKEDGPTWLLACRQLKSKWLRPGGDWLDRDGVLHGTNHYATAPVPLPAIGSAKFDVTDLVKKLKQGENTGMFLQCVENIERDLIAPPFFHDRTTATPPTLTIQTSGGPVVVPCLIDTWSTLSSAYALPAGSTTVGSTRNSFPCYMRFDLSQVTDVISAQLEFWWQNSFKIGTVFVDCLRMPALVHDPKRQIGGTRQGIARTVSNDKELANHPSVVFYPSFDSNNAVRTSGWDQLPSSYPADEDGVLKVALDAAYVDWPKYGVKALRMGTRYPEFPGPTIIAWQKYLNAGLKEGYFRHVFRISKEAVEGINEAGVKLPGPQGFPHADTQWVYRMEHEDQSASNPGVFALALHGYDATNPPGSGSAWQRYCLSHVKVETDICIEMYVKLNTKNAQGVYQPDGITRIWHDDVLVYEDTKALIVSTDLPEGNATFGEIFNNFYHGGQGTPHKQFFYEQSLMCVATEPIGMPPVVNGTPIPEPIPEPTPEPEQPAPPAYALPEAGKAVNIAKNTPNDVRPMVGTALMRDWVWSYALWGCYGGGAFVKDYSAHGAYVIAGSGGHGVPANIGGLIFDFSDGLFKRLDPTNGTWRESDYSVAETNGAPYYEVADQVPSPAHPYGLLIELPASMGGGPKGSVAYITRAAICNEAVHSPTAHRFDLSTGEWSRFSVNLAPRTKVDSFAVRDDARNRAWLLFNDMHAHKNRVYFDLTTKEFKTTPLWAAAYPPSAYASGGDFLHNGLLFRHGADSLYCYDPDVHNAGVLKLNVTGTWPGEILAAPWTFYPATGNFYKLPVNGGPTIWRLTPPADLKTGTWVVDSVPVDPVLPAAEGVKTNMTRFGYVASIGCLAYIAGGLRGVFLIRPGS